MPLQQCPKHILAGGRASAVGMLDQVKALLTAQLPRQFAPERSDGLLPVFPRLSRRVRRAVQHGDLGHRHIHELRLVEQRGDSGQIAQGALSRGEMVNRQHRVRLANPECGLELDHWITSLAAEPPCH